LAQGRASSRPFLSLDSPFHLGLPAVSSQGGLFYRRGLGTAARPVGCSTLTFRSFPLLLAGAFATSHFFLRCRRPHLAERCPHRWREGQRPKSAQHAAHFLDPGGRRKLPPLPPPRRWRQCEKFLQIPVAPRLEGARGLGQELQQDSCLLTRG